MRREGQLCDLVCVWQKVTAQRMNTVSRATLEWVAVAVIAEEKKLFRLHFGDNLRFDGEVWQIAS